MWSVLDSNQVSLRSVRFAIVAGPQFFGPAPLLTTLPPRFIPHCGRSAPRPIDVNDVLYQLSQQTIGTDALYRLISFLSRLDFPIP